jgi:trehalose 6-phosphate phosphatase
LEAATRALDRLNAGDLLKVLIEHKGAPSRFNTAKRPSMALSCAARPRRSHTGTASTSFLSHMMVELLSSRASKADAGALFMKTPPFVGRVPIALGDDETDEDAFAAVRDYGGAGVHVGERRRTLAKHRLATVKAVRSRLLASLGQALT